MLASGLLGIFNGLTIAVLAIGLVLVFRSGRFINFAQAELGIIPMLILGRLVLAGHMNWYLACALMIAFACVIGGLAEFLLIRRLANRSRLTVMVATIGLSQFLLAWTYFSWLPAPQREMVSVGYPMPFNVTWTFQNLPIFSYNVLTATVVPAICIALFIFFKYTVTGKAIRAAASNPDAATLSGLPIARLSTVTWVIAGALSAVGAILTAPSFSNFDPASIGPELMVPALAAAAFGGFTSFPQAFVAALGIGVAEQLADHFTSGTTAGEVVLFGSVLAALILRSKSIGQSGLAGVERVYRDTSRVIIPPSVRNRFTVKYSKVFLVVIPLVVASLVPLLPFFGDANQTFKVTEALILFLVVGSVTVLGGWGGQLSLGQYAFVGVAGFLTARIVPHGWTLPAIFLFCGAVGALLAVLLGLPALRYRGLALAVVTLAFAVLTSDWLLNESWFVLGAGAQGLSIRVPDLPGVGRLTTIHGFYYFTLILVTLIFLGLAVVRRSGAGRAMGAVRDNEDGAAAIGVPPAVVKLGLFALAGFLASVAGVLDVVATQYASTARYTPATSLLVVSIAVIGGLGSLPGVILGVVSLYLVPFFLYDYVKGVLPGDNQIQLLLSGAGLMLVVLFLPGGFVQDWRNKWGQYTRWLARRTEQRAAPEGDTGQLGGGEKSASDEIGAGRRRSHAERLTRAAELNAKAADERVNSSNNGGPVPEFALEAEGLTVTFGQLRALNDVALTVKPGEIVGLIGNNGAGKSTLINCIAGVTKPKSGRLTMFSDDLTTGGTSGRRRLGLGRTFQDARLFEGLTVREIVQVALTGRDYAGTISALLQMPWVRFENAWTAQRADEILASVGLTQYAETPAAELSTGLRRITDLAIQVAVRPKLVLLDEPTAGLAQREAEAFVPLLRRLVAELGASVLIVEHDMPVILGVTDRIYCLELGTVIAEGSPDAIRNDPRVIASYLGTTDSAAAMRSDALDASAAGRRAP